MHKMKWNNYDESSHENRHTKMQFYTLFSGIERSSINGKLVQLIIQHVSPVAGGARRSPIDFQVAIGGHWGGHWPQTRDQ